MFLRVSVSVMQRVMSEVLEVSIAVDIENTSILFLGCTPESRRTMPFNLIV